MDMERCAGRSWGRCTVLRRLFLFWLEVTVRGRLAGCGAQYGDHPGAGMDMETRTGPGVCHKAPIQ